MERAAIPISRPRLAPELAEIAAELDAAWRRVVASGHFILGPEVEAFGGRFGRLPGVKHAVGVNSGTDANRASRCGRSGSSGDEVVTTPFSFFATGSR